MRPTTAGPVWMPMPIRSGAGSSSARLRESVARARTMSPAATRARRLPSGARVHAEERHHAVAGELVRHAARPRDRLAHGLEVPVEEEDHVVGELPPGEPGESPEVG